MAANTELQRVDLSGWRTGLANLLRKENRAWWATRRWLVQSLVWAVVVNGSLSLLLYILPAPAETGGPLSNGIQLFFQLGIGFLPIGAIILAQGGIIGERQLGVTEWLLSKPVSRPAYVLAKLLAHGLGVLVILVGLQGAIAYGHLSAFMGQAFPLLPYLVGMGGLAVNILFYLTLTLMIGVLTSNRNAVLGVSLGVLLGGPLIKPLLGTFAMLTPWSLSDVLPAAGLAAVLGVPLSLPLPIWLPIAITAALSVIFVVVTLARFERLEF